MYARALALTGSWPRHTVPGRVGRVAQFVRVPAVALSGRDACMLTGAEAMGGADLANVHTLHYMLHRMLNITGPNTEHIMDSIALQDQEADTRLAAMAGATCGLQPIIQSLNKDILVLLYFKNLTKQAHARSMRCCKRVSACTVNQCRRACSPNATNIRRALTAL